MAFSINELIKPNTVIPQPNEEATKGGKLKAGTKTGNLKVLINKNIAFHLPLSGVTMEFDGNAKCVKGCRRNVSLHPYGKTPGIPGVFLCHMDALVI